MSLNITSSDFRLTVDASKDNEDEYYIQCWHWNTYGLRKVEFLISNYGCYADRNVNVIEGTVTKTESLEIVQALAEIM